MKFSTQESFMLQRSLAALLVLSGTFFPAVPALAESKSDAAGEVLSLEQAIGTAFAQNPELKALYQEAESAKARVSKARYWEDPMIGVRFYQIPFEGGFDETEDIDYIARQKFPLGGKAKAAREMAYHEYQHRLHALSGRGREILRDIKTTYYNLYSIGKRIGVSRELESNFRSLVSSAQARLATNQTFLTDAALAQTEIAKLLVERQALFQMQKELAAKLEQLMAVDSTAEIRLPAQLEVPQWEITLDQLLESAQAHQPALQSDKHHVEEKEWGLKAAKKEYLPDLNVQSEYVQRPGDRTDAFTGELMINIPLIVKKKSLGVKEAEAELAGARFMQQSTKNEIAYRVKQAFSKMQSSENTLALNRGTLLPQARQAHQATFAAYTTGKIGVVPALDAARTLLTAQGDYWRSFEEHAATVFALENDVGLTQEEWKQGEEKLPLQEISKDMKE
jgi:cobalt-zinc-cadmium efflux system outer membrane protein